MPQNSNHSGVLSALAVFPSFSGYTNTKQQGGEKMAIDALFRFYQSAIKPKDIRFSDSALYTSNSIEEYIEIRQGEEK